MAGAEIRWASLLPDGRVLLACDEWPAWPGRQVLLAWDLAAGTFTRLDPVLEGAHRAVPLADGSLLLWMWRTRDQVLTSGEVTRHEHYTLARLDPMTGSLQHLPGAPLAESTAVLLRDGRVGIVGGFAMDATSRCLTPVPGCSRRSPRSRPRVPPPRWWRLDPGSWRCWAGMAATG
jgi:hypothetical protein